MALKTAKQVEDLANKLSESADVMHARLMQAIRKKEIDHASAQSLFQDESALRQRANSLYIDAAACVVKELEESQAGMIAAIDAANRKIGKMKQIAAFVDLIADLLVLAAAAYAAKPAPILAALKEIKADVDALTQ